MIDSNFMLHPHEDRVNKQLQLVCKVCPYRRNTTNNYVYINKLKADSTTKLQRVNPDFAKDPTLPRTFTSKCPKCRGHEAVFFMSRSGEKGSDMGLIFLCANEACNHSWTN